MTAVAVEITIVGLLILLNGVFAMAEMAIVTARRVRLEQRAARGDRGAQAALDLANEPSQFLSTVQIGITLVGILAGAFGGATLSRFVAAQIAGVPLLAPYADGIGLVVIVLGIAYMTLIFGELVPKRYAMNNPERIATLVAAPMRMISRAAAPAVALLSGSTELVLRGLGVRPREEEHITEEEITLQIARGARAGVFDDAERRIVEAVFRLGDRTIGSLMTPRREVVWLDLDQDSESSIRRVVGSRHSYYPVARGDLDLVEGVVSARDIMAATSLGEVPDFRALARPPLFVPESLHAFRMLEQFKEHGTHVCLVVDEYGGTQGVLTLTDILDALVGAIPSLGEEREVTIVRREDGSWLVDGQLALDDARELLDLPALSGDRSGEFYSVGGLVMHELGRIARVGDVVELSGWRFEVVDMDAHRIDKVLVSAPSTPGA